MSRFPGSLALVSSIALFGRKAVTTTRIATLCSLGCVAVLGSQVLAQAATTTTLTITSGGSAVSTVPMGTVVTLTATVMAGSTPVSPGQVNFCDATAAHCEDIHIVGTAQLTSAGTAVVRFRPGVGSHSYNAVFLGTPNGFPARAGSSSGNGSLTVTAPSLYPSVTVMSVAGSTGAYQLGASVSGIGAAPPTGTVSFIDTSNGNAQLGTASLSNARSSFGLANLSSPVGGASIEVADFNQDGILDMLVQDTVLLGNVDGTFTAAPNPISNALVGPVVVGDFNGDGIPDIAGINVGVLLGNGDGTFRAAPTSPSIGINLFPQLITAGDFNGDGNLDLAILSADAGGIEHAFQVTIMLGHGDGTFTTGPTTSLTGGVELDLTFTSVSVADLNGDGKLDIFATSEPSEACLPEIGQSSCNEGSLSILLGNGDGTFNPSTIDLGTGPIYLGATAAADLNGDGIPDLAVVGGANNVGLVYLLQGNGDGTYTTQNPLNLGAEYTTYSLAVGDFNGNGVSDLALTYGYSAPGADSSGLMLFFGKGDGTFNAPPFQFPSAGVESSCCANGGLAVGDFNGDGLQDLAAPGSVLLSQTQFDTAPPETPIVLTGVGTHLIAASYQGDANYATSTSAATALNLSSGAPTVTLTLSANPTNYGTPETSTVVVSGSGPTPTGTVTVNYIGQGGALNPESEYCVATLNNSGVATCTTTARLLGGGMYSVVASYSGDTNYPSTNSSPISLSVYDQTASEINWNNPLPVPYGTALGPQQLNAFCNAPGTFSYSPAAGTVLGPGTYTLTATFTPTDPLANAPATATVQFAVLQGTSMVGWPGPAPIPYGTALSPTQLNATVAVFVNSEYFPVAGAFVYTPVAGTVLGAGIHTLSVTFTPTDTTDYTTATVTVSLTVTQATPTITWPTPAAISFGTALGASQLNATASVPGSFVYTPAAGTVPAVGSQTLSVAFTPTDATDYKAATSSVTLTVNKATPTIALATSSTSAFVLNPVIFTATLASPSGTPTGTVAFYDGMALLSTEAMTSGIATYQTSALLAGTHPITAVYSGDATFATVTSSAVSQVIENFTIGASGGTSSVTANPGGQAVYTFTVTPPNGTTFAGPISFSVTGLPAGATAAFAPTTVPAGAGVTTVTMTVTLAATAAVHPADRGFPGGALPIALGLILLPFAGSLRRKARGLKGTVCLLMIGVALAAGLTSCGGGSGGGGGESTPPQNYVLTVTATAGSLLNTFAVGLEVD